MVKEFLSQRGVSYKEFDVSVDRTAAQEMVNKTGQMGVPVTTIDGEVIVGFDRPQLEQALSQQKPIFGASLADANKITARKQAKAFTGAYVGKVKPNSTAQRLGLVSGDIITSLNSRSVKNVDDFESAIKSLGKGSHISVGYVRGEQQLTTQGAI